VLALVIAAVIGGGVLLPLTSARAAVRNPMQTHVIANGIKLTLTVPRHTYLQDELVQLSVHIQNVSARTVELSSNPDFDFCGSPNPAVVVRDENGRWLYPPAAMCSSRSGRAADGHYPSRWVGKSERTKSRARSASRSAIASSSSCPRFASAVVSGSFELSSTPVSTPM
jgi:hypothetical protein